MTRSAAAAAAPATPELTRVVVPCELRVVDEEKREVEVCATSEAVDTYGTIFDYEASKDAFARWYGNVREMHQSVAVGRKVALRFDDAQKKVYARVRISRGAEDTWQKVLDGTLSGASIGAANTEWAHRRVAGKSVPVCTRYDLMELSLVDLASNPDARGLEIIRDAVPVAEGLDDVGVGEGIAAVSSASRGADDVSGAASGSVPAAPSPSLGSAQIIEDAGTLSAEDVNAAIQRAALARAAQPSLPPLGADAKRARLAALGAPGYAGRAAGTTQGETFPTGAPSAAGDALGGTAPTTSDGSGVPGPGQPYDDDGDHHDGMMPVDVPLQSGPTAGAVFAPSPAGSVVHMAHNHQHVGHTTHREASGHMHLDGTSHVHEHVMDHEHGHHDGLPAQGHAHTHVHVPDHSHYYRCADGSPIDARLVTVEQVRTWEYVSEAAFRAAGGVEGRALTVPQFRVAQAHELRALGPYSRDEAGPADAGTPAQVAPAPTSDIAPENGGEPALNLLDIANAFLARLGLAPLAQGNVRALDRDGQPIAAADPNGCQPTDASTTGTLDVSQPADGWTGRNVVAEITRAVESQVQRLAGTLAEIQQRVQRIEQTPMPGGPYLRGAAPDKTTALTPASGGSPAEQMRALEGLAGRIRDPQAQVAVAAEMIRLQQEAAGLGPEFQVMPRAGTGWR